MSTRILLVAHSPLASALRDCAMHVFPDCAQHLLVLDVQPDASPEDSLAQARQLMGTQDQGALLVLTDVFGATPSNIAQRLVEGRQARLVTGVNLPMLLRCVCYRGEALDALVQRAIVGGTQGVMQVAVTAPQNQNR
ncbi:MAG: PTS sugar transporter subunit IIA, partial [Giesbergeria sp.]